MLHERKARLAEGHASMSSAPSDNPSARGHAPRVGAELRAAREHRGWNLEELAAGLRIRAAYLEAIEDGRVADLPGNAYALGFLRTYAVALGLEPDDVSRRFRTEVAEVNTKTELTFPAPVPDRGVPAGAVVLLGLVLAVGAYAGWYRLADHAVPPHPVTPVPERLARLADPTSLAPAHPLPERAPAPQAVPSGGPASSVASGPAGASLGASAGASPGALASSPPAGPAPAPASAGAPPPAAQAPASLAAANPPAASEPGSSTASSSGPASNAALAAVSSLAPPANAATPPLPPPGTITVRATAAAWIEVRDQTGAVVFTKLMQPGESWTVPRHAGLVLTTGNAGGTELLVDGRPAPPLGSPGMVVRDQPLDAGLIKAGALPAQIAAAASGAPAYTPASIHATQGPDPTQ